MQSLTTRRLKELGAPLLEMVLCIPLALLFLFVVIDGGLSLLERAAITDALRAGLNSELIYRQGRAVLSLDANLNAVTDEAAAYALLSGVAQEIAANINDMQSFGLSAEETPFKVLITAVIADVNSQNGVLTETYQVLEPVIAGDPNFELAEYNSNIEISGREDYINQQLKAASGDANRPSPYAVPLGVDYGTAASPLVQPRYLNKAVLIYANVTALTRGFDRQYANTVLGSFYGLQDQQLVLLRTQLG